MRENCHYIEDFFNLLKIKNFCFFFNLEIRNKAKGVQYEGILLIIV